MTGSLRAAALVLLGAALLSPRAVALDDTELRGGRDALLATLTEDPSPLFALGMDLRDGLLLRPELPGASEFTTGAPALRVHLAPGADHSDADLDSVPDRVQAAQLAALAALDVCARAGLGGPRDDGDAEIDIYLAPFGGALRGFAVLERRDPSGRGASGFVVADVSARWSIEQLSAAVARSVARLVLAARDAGAPAWWTEPSALWIEQQVTGRPPNQEELQAGRWDEAETGVLAPSFLLARGNLALLDALGHEGVAARLLAESWRALERRGLGETPVDTVDAASRAVTGLDLAGLFERAAIAQLAEGTRPGRWSLEAGATPLLDAPLDRAVAPGGAALVRLAPAGLNPDAMRLSVVRPDRAWSLSLLAARRGGGWDLTRLPHGDEPRIEILLPWSDYREAVLVATRWLDAPGSGRLALSTRPAGPFEPFALSAFGGHRTPGGAIEINWTSAGETALFGWLVERAPQAGGPWEPILDLPVPALGLPRNGSSYSVIDNDPLGSAAAHYRVVGLTTLGLRVSGPALLVAAP